MVEIIGGCFWVVFFMLALWQAATWVIPSEGSVVSLGRALQTTGAAAAEDFTLDLYSNNYTPILASTLSNFTLATFTGYASVSIVNTTFPAPTTTSGVTSTTSTTPGAFTCTGGSAQTIYGCVLSGATTGKVIAAALFDNSRSMSNGATETVTVALQGLSG